MASLSMKELSKRNNFNIFVKRIAIGQGFYFVGIDELIILDPSILLNIEDLNGLNYYKEKKSILLPTKNGNRVKLTDLYKDSEFSNRSQNTTIKQDLEVYSLNNKLQEIKKRTNKQYVNVRLNNIIHPVVSVVDSSFKHKSDFNFIDINGNDIFYISHKDGRTPKDFQQWSGTSKKFQKSIFEHPETQSFISTIKTMGFELPRATTIARRINSDFLKQMAIYGYEFNFFLHCVPYILKKINNEIKNF